jgi:iron(III) transport system substrate-binding protein
MYIKYYILEILMGEVMNKYNVAIAFTVILAVLFSGCIGGQNSNDSEEKVLTVYAAYGGMETIAKEFEKDTGIKMEYVSMSSGEALSRLNAEKNNPSCDVWFGGGVDAFISAKKDGVITPYKSPNVEYIDKKFVDKDYYWTGVSLVTIGILENEDLVKKKNLPEPKTWDDLLKPEYKGEIIASNPTISGTAYFTICGILQMKGEEEGWKYMDKLYENVPFLTKRGSGPKKKVTSGEYAFGISPNPHNEPMRNKELPIKAIYLDKVIWWPAPVAIVKDCKHPDNAKVFVDWVLSKRGQEALMAASPRVPVRSDLETIEGVPNPKDLDFVDMDFVYWGENRDAVLDKWKERYQTITTQ